MTAMNRSHAPTRLVLVAAALGTALATAATALPAAPATAVPLAAATVAASGAAPAAVPARTAAPIPARTAAAPRAGRLAIGDSVMLGAARPLRRAGFTVDAAVSRQFSTASGILRRYGARVPRNVVLALGTNGTITTSACRAFVTAAGSGRRVFLVTNKVPRRWEASNNTALRRCDAAFPASRVVLVDWHALAVRNPSWFYGDGYHLKPTGQAAYTRLLDGAVDRSGL